MGASGTNAIVVYQTDVAGNQDLKCSYTTNNGVNWVHDITVAGTSSDEVSPRVSMVGDTVYCTYVKGGDLWLTISNDSGATWDAPIQINDNAGTVVDDWHESDIKVPDIIWSDTRGTDQDLYYDYYGAPPPLLPHLTLSLVSGGMGLTGAVTNDGQAEATNVAGTLKVTGGILHRINISKPFNFSAVAVGSNETFKSGIFLGLGTISIEMTASCDQGVSDSKTFTGKVIFFYVKI